MRDAKRFVTFYNWFYKSIPERDHKDDNLIFKSIFLSIYICYFLRIPAKDEKDKLYDELSLLLQKLGKKMIKQKQYMRGMINNEMVQLANHISFPEGIAMNTGL